MKLPVDWLNEYLTTPLPTAAMAEALERAGVEVEAIITAPKLDAKIVVGEVVKLQPHPDADSLRLAEVDVKDATLAIVCGAPNLAVGQKVPVALVGASLPDGTEIKPAKLRGVVSEGMICSERELGLGENHQGIMILAADAVPGQPVAGLITQSDIIDTTTAANRWDLNGLIGLAREVAAHSDQKTALKLPEQLTGSGPAPEVVIAAPQLVDRYLVAKLEVDAAKPSPSWLQQRLQAAGVRPISVVVDITNYCMLEYGQPLHAFDAAKVKLPITVRLAEPGEKLVTLDGETHTLDPADLLIADAASAIGLAGVMGGRNSEIEAATTAIYLESASFNGPSLRRTALRHGLRTDASARFERNLPVNLAPIALARAVQLLTELADAKLVGAPADQQQTEATITHIAIQPARIAALLGLELSAEEIITQLTKLEFALDTSGADLTVVPPWWRPDIQQEADLAEEVMKLVGYDQLPATLPTWVPDRVTPDTRWPRRWQAVAALRSLGLFQVQTYSFIAQDQITGLQRDPAAALALQNPLSTEQAHLRTDLLPSLLRVAERNRTYAPEFGLFELSKVYHPTEKGELPTEPTHLAVLIRAESGGYRRAKAALDRLARELNVELAVRPGVLEPAVAHPTRSAIISLGDTEIGWIAQLHPALITTTKTGGELAYLEIDWDVLSAAARPVQYREISRYPAITRDLSILVKRETTWQELAAALRDYQVAFVNDYYGAGLPAGKKAVALRLTIVAPDRTLTDADADKVAGDALSRLQRDFQAELRA